MRWVQIYLKLNNKGIFYSQSPATTECGWGWRGMDTTRQAATQYKKVYSSAEELKEWRGTGEETPIIFSKRMHSSLFGLEMRLILSWRFFPTHQFIHWTTLTCVLRDNNNEKDNNNWLFRDELVRSESSSPPSPDEWFVGVSINYCWPN